MRLDVLLVLAALVAAGCDRGSRAEAPAGETRPEAVTITVAYSKGGWPVRSYTVNGLISSYH